MLLPGSEPPLGFLSLLTWVDLQRGAADSDLGLLTAAVRREPLDPAHKDHIEDTIRAICPYLGSKAFREEDAAFFCGRDLFINKLTERVQGATVAVVGASGSGKSSVVRAGLVPRLRHIGEGQVCSRVPENGAGPKLRRHTSSPPCSRSSIPK